MWFLLFVFVGARVDGVWERLPPEGVAWKDGCCETFATARCVCFAMPAEILRGKRPCVSGQLLGTEIRVGDPARLGLTWRPGALATASVPSPSLHPLGQTSAR